MIDQGDGEIDGGAGNYGGAGDGDSCRKMKATRKQSMTGGAGDGEAAGANGGAGEASLVQLGSTPMNDKSEGAPLRLSSDPTLRQVQIDRMRTRLAANAVAEGGSSDLLFTI